MRLFVLVRHGQSELNATRRVNGDPDVAAARAGGRRILLTTALAVAFFFIPILAAVQADLPWVAVFHPVSAILGFWLALVVARGATNLVRSSEPAPSTTIAEWILVALVIVAILFLSFSGSPSP